MGSCCLRTKRIIWLSLSRLWNNTYVFDASATGSNGNSCSDQVYDDNAPNACAGTLGGFFNQQASTTYSKASSLRALNTAGETFPDHMDDVYGSDTLEVNSTLSLANFPVGVNRGKADNQNGLGMGRNSTLLNALVSNGTISSKTWSFWNGWTGTEAQHQMDGSLIFGGYDAAKISGKNITLPFSSENDCLRGYVVTISDIKLNLVNGSTASILGPSHGTAMRACVAPDYPIISLSVDIWTAFVEASGVIEVGRSFGTNFFGMLIANNAS